MSDKDILHSLPKEDCAIVDIRDGDDIMGFRERVARYLTGRNGMDDMAKMSLVLSVIFVVITLITNNAFVYIISLVLLVYSYFRIMSRNISRRYYENQQYMKYTAPVRNRINRWLYKVTGGNYHPGGSMQQFRADMANIRAKMANDREQRKIYRYYTCPKCRQKVRVPRGRGKIAITCPKCDFQFIKRS